MNMGGCVVSRNILEGLGRLKWCVRDASVNEVDTGWRFFSDIDTEEFLSDHKNMSVCKYETVIDIEPAVLGIYDFPQGTDLRLEQEGKRKFFVNNLDGKVIEF